MNSEADLLVPPYPVMSCWVNFRTSARGIAKSAFPCERTSPSTAAKSALCHNRTHAPQQTASLFDHLVRTQQK
jgi:hypothetical protein